MPEIKNTFLQGKMNKDIDERLMPTGQYRHAMNVEVSTSEGSNVGTVKNILGNKRVEQLVDASRFKCVGSVANERNNKIYWFISSYEVDAILEYDVDLDEAVPVIVDAYASLDKSVLKFKGNTITGINIIDNLLFWTDNHGEPKKINIDTCKLGTVPHALDNFNSPIHTQLSFDNGSFYGITVERLSNSSSGGSTGLKVGRYVYFERNQLNKLHPNVGTWQYSSFLIKLRHYRDGKFLGLKEVTAWDNNNGTHLRLGSLYSQSSETDWRLGDVLFGNNVTIDIEHSHITVIKPKPLTAPSVKINYDDKTHSGSSVKLSVSSKNKISNLFETKFPRFSYRYKYRDGEFSPTAPFTQPVFNPKYTNINSPDSTGVSISKDDAYDIKDGYNKAMVNSIHSVELSDFITTLTPEDVVEIDILYKQEDSPVIYSIGTIDHLNPDWHKNSNHEGFDIGTRPNFNPGEKWRALGGLTKGKYLVKTENIYAALPANQLLRPWDNVPRRAKAQEITGSRIVYGNYLQNYNLGSSKPIVKVDYSDRISKLGDFDSQGLPSVKSKRNYQLGVVYADKYGRETPVFTSTEGAINIPWKSPGNLKNASRSLQLNAMIPSNFPEWVDSVKFFVKENSQEYYNLVMDRAWVLEKTYHLDNSEGHIWISFASSDRNKLQEGDYITLKKKIGTGEGQVDFENKFKVLDIQNEAPDAIKYELVNYGSWRHYNSTNLQMQTLFTSANRPDAEGKRQLIIERDKWRNRYFSPLKTGGVDGNVNAQEELGTRDLYVSWQDVVTGEMSSKYRVENGRMSSTSIVLRLNSRISAKDADIAHKDGDSSSVPVAGDAFNTDLVFIVEQKRLKDDQDFSGKFFVKISENEITDLVTEGQIGAWQSSGNSAGNDYLDSSYMVYSRANTWYWEDAKGTNVELDHNSYGVTNHHGTIYHSTATTTTANIRHPDNNDNVGFSRPDSSSTVDARVTDWYAPWDGILAQHGDKGAFFVDAMYLTAGQSSTTNLAKYCHFPMAGCTKGHKDSPEVSSWSYPPLKVWWTDFKKSASLLESLDSDSEDKNWYNNDMISVVGGVGGYGSGGTAKEDWGNLEIDGWIGPLQKVDRDPGVTGSRYNNHVNGLEGFTKTYNDHVNGPRRWVSGITENSSDYSNGVDTGVYGDDNDERGRYFIHLSYFAPGKDLHNGNWDEYNTTDGQEEIYGSNAISRKLQGIWGGGHFTKRTKTGKLGNDSANSWDHLPMEINNDDNTYEPLEEAPGPGIGYGYDINYEEDHNRQWDPTYGPGNEDIDGTKRAFINKLIPGSKFKFSNDTNSSSPTIFTIRNVVTKKIYNHTSWRNTFNLWEDGGQGYYDIDGLEDAYQSVEYMGLRWMDYFSGNQVTDSGTGETYLQDFKDKIEQFGSRSNRRICYIIEIDKDPMQDGNHEFLNYIYGTGPHGNMNAKVATNQYANIEFIEKVKSPALADLNKFPAIWETDPKKLDVDLDIYYEASNHIPVKITHQTNEIFAPIGCKVEILNATTPSICTLLRWDGNEAIFRPGFSRGDGVNEIDYTGVSFKFTRQDGSYTIAQASSQQLVGETSNTVMKENFLFRPDVGDSIRAGLNWYNCFSFGNGIESNRIRDDFNQMTIVNGVKASTVTQQTYEEERRSHGLIYSGLYNSNSGVNDLNQFIMAEKITKDLNPTYGSIQKLFSRDTDLVTFCEDKVIKVLANKDAVFNADGNPQLTANENVLGQSIPFVGDYGISKNPESFASESYRAYFTDKARGAVLRLSKDGLTAISKAGMHDYFRDELPKYSALIGSFDAYKEQYNITLSKSYGENIIFNSFLQEGMLSNTVEGSIVNLVVNGQVYSGDNLRIPYEQYNVETYDGFMLKSGQPDFTNPYLKSTVKTVNHAAIPYGSLQQRIDGQAQVDPIYQTVSGLDPNTGLAYQDYSSGVYSEDLGQFVSVGQGDQTAFAIAEYQRYTSPGTLPNSGGSLPGQFYAADYSTVTNDIFGGASGTTGDTDPNIFSRVHRTSSGVEVSKSNPSNHNDVGNFPYTNYSSYYYSKDSSQGVPIVWPRPQSAVYHYPSGVPQGSFKGMHVNGTGTPSGTITRDTITSYITFDSCYDKSAFPGPGNYPISLPTYATTLHNPEDYFVEIRAIGTSNGTNAQDGDLNATYHAHSGIPTHGHNAIYNGEELHVVVTLKCFITGDTNSGNYDDENIHGYNIIEPYIQLVDGTSGPISNDLIVQGLDATSTTANGGYQPVDVVGNIYTGVYNHQFATRLSACGNAATDMVYHSSSQTLKTYQASTSGPSDYWNYHGWSNGQGRVDFISTDNLSIAKTSTYSSFPYNVGTTFTIRIAASWKFRDPNQQDTSGGGTDITDQLLIPDLGIRIGQSAGPGHAGNTSFQPFSYSPFQLWQIVDVTAVKGLGITAPNVAAQAETFVDVWQSNWTDVTIITNPGNIQGAIAYVDAVPPFDVPAWTEVIHQGLNGWTNDHANANISGYSGHIRAMEGSGSGVGTLRFGNTYNKVTQYGNEVNLDISQPPTQNAIEYVVPQDWGYGASDNVDQNGHDMTDTLSNANSSAPANGTPFFHSDNNPSGSTAPGNSFDRTNSNNNSYSYKTITPENYVVFKTASNGWVHLIRTLDSQTQWSVGSWYLVDLEVKTDGGFNANLGDNVFPINSGGTTGNGTVTIHNVIDKNTGAAINSMYQDVTLQSANIDKSTWDNDTIARRGVGVRRGSSGNAVLGLIPTIRTEYGNSDGSGDNQKVLRAIFKVDANSPAANSNANAKQLKLTFYGVESSSVIQRIIVKRLDGFDFKGEADSWEHANSNDQQPFHAFSSKQLYWKTPHMCFNVPDGVPGWFRQNFNKTVGDQGSGDTGNNYPIPTSDAPTVSAYGWKLKFTVSANPDTGNFNPGVDGLKVFVTSDFGENGAAANNYHGAQVSGIQDEGNYELFFNMDGNANKEVTLPDGTVEPWYIKRSTDNGVTWSDYTTANIVSLATSTWVDGASQIRFRGSDTGSSGITAMELAISKVSLTDSSVVFQSANIGSWNINGFDSTQYQYIRWNSGNEGRIEFNQMPFVDPTSISAQKTPISISQNINKTINKGEKYLIEFDYLVENAHLKLYYYNSVGEGFSIEPMETYANDPSNPGTKSGTYSKVHEIGEHKWNNTNPDGNQYDSRLKNTLVILKGSGANLMDGWIDNIKMTRFHDDNELEETTVSFSENVKGWTSFKSFIPESGLSISKQYFTIDNAALWKHYIPKLNGSDITLDAEGNTVSVDVLKADNYNTFYGNYTNSSITTVLNEEPSLVKTFHAINYEGDQARVLIPINKYLANHNNSLEFINEEETKGWYCENIKTNLDSGTVQEFIKKEGKWFNYIKGKTLDKSNIDTTLFSVQGIGVSSSIEILGSSTPTSAP